MCKLLKRTCLAIVPPFGPLTLPRPRCRLCRGLLKVLNKGLSLTALDAYGRVISFLKLVSSVTMV